MFVSICVWVIFLQNEREIQENRSFYAWQVVCLVVAFVVVFNVRVTRGGRSQITNSATMAA